MMKLTKPFAQTLSMAGAVAAALLASGQVSAATTIAANQNNYTLGKPVTNTVQAAAWYNSAFGAAGWTHFSKWGKVTLQAGRTYEISVVSSDKRLHPGLTLWYRYTGSAKTYASPDFFIGHSYLQNISIDAKNQINEADNKNLKTIKMDLVTFGYDADRDPATTDAADANPKKNVAFPYGDLVYNAVKDNVPGKLTLKFKAMKSGTYQFVYGGVGPDDGNSAAKVAATASTPEVPAGFNNNGFRIPVTVTIKQVAK